ncbi:MAG TPA: SagB/ThcOx family dehydrogenase [Candidatus Omnitrophica bacterium]|nr:SagB/ThcOx family dehydrogenase [Candidatus Omnitrophota bacterium]
MGLANNSYSKEIIKLPFFKKRGRICLEEVLDQRQSIRKYSPDPLRIEEISQLLWAAYGKNQWKKKTVPSAGALYPLVIYLFAKKVEEIPLGLYEYHPQNHTLSLISASDLSFSLYKACLKQEWIKEAKAAIFICANYKITTSYYGKRGFRYVYMEAGHSGQNIYLEATALNLGTVAIGAFNDEEVKRVLAVEEEPLYIFPIGRPK